MFKIKSHECEDISYDQHQGRPTLAGDSSVHMSSAKTYTESAGGRGKRGRRGISEEATTATTLPPEHAMMCSNQYSDVIKSAGFCSTNVSNNCCSNIKKNTTYFSD